MLTQTELFQAYIEVKEPILDDGKKTSYFNTESLSSFGERVSFSRKRT